MRLVGHSFGGSVALKAALLLGERASRLVLLEPNPFHLLQQAGRDAAWREISGLREDVTGRIAAGDWPRRAQRSSPTTGSATAPGDAMPEGAAPPSPRRCRPNLYEWQAVMDEQTRVEELRGRRRRARSS